MAENIDETIQEAKGKTRNVVSRHPMRAGAATMAVIFGTGYLIGQKRAESQSKYSKFLRRLSDM
ncbi:MAG TPA: hypothetical protein VG964_02740 [Candidatus Saccharimonadales bacterium]|nr:hypothetical protein [Candidatus Saccharimonadales bacterium]